MAYSLAPAALAAAYTAIWDGLDAGGDDVGRWFAEGFVLSPPTSAVPFALRQSSGGPCGVLAAVQAYALARLLFLVHLADADAAPDGAPLALTLPAAPGASTTAAAHALLTSQPPAVVHEALAHALAFLLWQAAGGTAGGGAGPRTAVVVTVPPAALPLTPAALTGGGGGAAPAVPVTAHPFDSFAALQAFIASEPVWPQWGSASGVVLALLSLVTTRGLDRLAADADEPGSPLVARFGHCSQELLNLCLTGAGTSNVWDGVHGLGADGEMAPVEAAAAAVTTAGGGGSSSAAASDAPVFTMRGVLRTPLVGYLSTLESLRYTRVGGRYKAPRLPCWVVGSESHFTLLFGADPGVNEESASAGVRRAFAAYDAVDGGFIPADKLPAVLADVGLGGLVGTPAGDALRRQLDSAGAGIIVWAEFWSAVAPLVDSLRPQPTPVAGSGAAGAGVGASGSAPALSASSSSSSAAAAVAAPPPAPAAAASATADAAVDAVWRAWEAADAAGGGMGFVPLPALRSELHTALALPPPSPGDAAAPPGSAAGAVYDALRAITDPPSAPNAIALRDDVEASLVPAVRRFFEAAAAASAVRAPAVVAAAGGARPRTDSDVARELAAQWEAEEEAMGREAAAALFGGGSGSSAAAAPAPAPAAAAAAPAPPPLFDLSQWGISSPPPAAGAGGTAAAGGGSSGTKRPRTASASSTTATASASPPRAGVSPAALAAAASLPALSLPPVATALPGASSSSSAYRSSSAVRTFELFHLNGLEDRGQHPRCVRLLLRQAESGFPPGMGDVDVAPAGAAAAAGGGVGTDGMDASDLEVAALIAMTHPDAGGGGGGDGGGDGASAASAASSAASSSTVSSSSAAAGGTNNLPSAKESRRRLDALEGVLRTKWPGVALQVEGGAPPSLD